MEKGLGGGVGIAAALLAPLRERGESPRKLDVQPETGTFANRGLLTRLRSM